jgi:hypothetical protein
MPSQLNALQGGGSPMGLVIVERLDHLGVVSSVIKDLGIIEMIDARLPPMTKKRSPQAKPWRE